MGLIRGVLFAAAALLFAAVMLPAAAAKLYTVGGKVGWSESGVNYTIWAQNIRFNTEDWLFFVYDRNVANVLEVSKTDYERCNSEHPIYNWTTGAGRDVVLLNVTKTFYFLSETKTTCHRGMKVAIHVHNPQPPPPPPSPPTSSPPPPPPTSSLTPSPFPPPPPPTSSPPPPPPTSSLTPSPFPPPPPPTSSPTPSPSTSPPPVNMPLYKQTQEAVQNSASKIREPKLKRSLAIFYYYFPFFLCIFLF